MVLWVVVAVLVILFHNSVIRHYITVYHYSGVGSGVGSSVVVVGVVVAVLVIVFHKVLATLIDILATR